ncbi:MULTISPECIES: sigma-70 family RNA polymerase sigma factor [unclassified Actinopolyspora]|uniref:sigma-70 family RNA polymerase sigma factor n=1 Tax=unclassified Actinopolyspora TaxID=2639451 RepID=UPI0013F64B50|nr:MULTISPECIES: sigma-70 family RNA polymerase sigma factor [unclassified Actinopolyspora]NHD16016.1 sigma-70 family RNA polymerase sigma factor [Actinopolyspora sp. BKK2]NHE74770.1 sigma-70 family RNA polymerase sigma factor [Actinopolyspora sp. BKK1]
MHTSTPDARAQARRRAVAALCEHATQANRVQLSVPDVQAAVHEHAVAQQEFPLLLRELLDAGMQLPPALSGSAAPPEATAPAAPADPEGTEQPPAEAPPAEAPPEREPAGALVLHGHERLDTSSISLADLGQPLPAPREPEQPGAAPADEPEIGPEVAPELPGTGAEPDSTAELALGPESEPAAAPEIPAPETAIEPEVEPDSTTELPAAEHTPETSTAGHRERGRIRRIPTPAPKYLPALPDPRQQPGGGASIDPRIQYRKEINKYALLSAEQEVELAKTIENGSSARHRLNTEQLLSTSLTAELESLVRQGDRAFADFVTANLRLVHSVAEEYRGRGLEQLDLIQEGTLGLWRAVQKFDYRKGNKFSTYATWWIRQRITRALADQVRTIRYPVHLVEQLNPVLSAQRFLRESRGSADYTSIAAHADISPEQVRSLLTELPRSSSLEQLLEQLDETTLHEANERYRDSAEPDLFGLDPEDVHRALLEWCDERERHILHRRYGFRGEPGTLETIGREYGVTRERIRQIERKALKRITEVLPRFREEKPLAEVLAFPTRKTVTRRRRQHPGSGTEPAHEHREEHHEHEDAEADAD